MGKARLTRGVVLDWNRRRGTGPSASVGRVKLKCGPVLVEKGGRVPRGAAGARGGRWERERRPVRGCGRPCGPSAGRKAGLSAQAVLGHAGFGPKGEGKAGLLGWFAGPGEEGKAGPVWEKGWA